MLDTKNRKHQRSSEKASFNYQNHPSVTNNKDIMKSKIFPLSVSTLFQLTKWNILLKILILKKLVQTAMYLWSLKNEWRHLFKISISKCQPISCQFPHCLKQTEVTPVFKNMKKHDKSNNRPVNVSPVISKIYERLMYDQMFNILIKSSLNFNVVFVKDLALRNCLLYMIKNRKESLDQGGHYGALLTD